MKQSGEVIGEISFLTGMRNFDVSLDLPSRRCNLYALQLRIHNNPRNVLRRSSRSFCACDTACKRLERTTEPTVVYAMASIR